MFGDKMLVIIASDFVRAEEHCLYQCRLAVRVSGLEIVRTLYYAYFESLLLYGLIFWGNSENAKLIFRLQKRAIRTTMQITKIISCKQYFKSLRILPLPCLYIYIYIYI
jgi:hypothetical protein